MHTATQTGKQPKMLSLEQEMLKREFTQTYNIKDSQISFDGDSLEPIFDFDALSLLSLELSDIQNIRIEPHNLDNIHNIATALGEVHLPDGRSREIFGSAMVGEPMHDGLIILDMRQALDIAQARALRKGLRIVGFDPVEAHRLHKEAPLNLKLGTPEEQRKKELAEAHALGTELGLITASGDKANWYRMISIWFPELTPASSAAMNDEQRNRFITTLRALKNAHASTLTHASAQGSQS